MRGRGRGTGAERHERAPLRQRGACAAVVLAAAACGGLDPSEGSAPRPDPSPDTARLSQHETLLADLAAPRSAADGAGRATLVEGPELPVAGSAHTFRLRFEVSRHGVAEGGYVLLMPEPYWGWSTPQVERSDLPGYTEVALDARADAARLDARSFGGAEAGMLILGVEGAALVEGDTIDLVYGAGPAGARVDRYAGRGARLWFGVDGDGDGVREIVPRSPTVDVAPRPAERIVLLGPSVARPGMTVRYHVSALDDLANRAPAPGATVELAGAPADWDLPPRVELDARGFASIEVIVGAAQTAAVRLRARTDLDGGRVVRATANPLVVDADAPRVAWGDLHGHTGASDGTGVAEDYFAYARETARLDFCALTEHDHFGVRFLDARPGAWADVQRAVADAHAPPEFVALLGYEWTSWVHGHRHVVHFAAEGPLVSSIGDAASGAAATPAALWQRLSGLPALTLAHHSSGSPIPVNWSYPPDPVLEPLTEVSSIHGQSEFPSDTPPAAVAGSVPGQFVREQLDRGYRLGFVGSGDTHDGHPGLGHLSPLVGWRAPAAGGPAAGGPARSGRGGLAAVWLDGGALDRRGLLGRLRARAAYATSGPRILVHVAPRGSDGDLVVRARATSRFTRAVEVRGPRLTANGRIRTGETGATERSYLLAGNRPDHELVLEGALLERHAYVYLRLEQDDGSAAWVGPFWPRGRGRASDRR